MKKIILSSTVAALLMLSGCSSKNPSVDASTNSQNAQQVEVVEEIVAIDENGIANVDQNEMNMLGLERKMEVIYFDFDKFNVREDMQQNVKSNSDLANAAASSYTIKLEGNCDEWGSDEYNYALGLKRAEATKKDAIANGVNSSRITMVSYGESNPVCSEKTKDCWSKNRRVNFKLLP
jgi:peptidoglycan-associated lipoprotein